MYLLIIDVGINHVEVYTRPGDQQGYESDQRGWTSANNKHNVLKGLEEYTL